MTDYTPIKDFAVKDNLAATDPERLIRGAEIQDELNAIADSIETKLDIGEVLPDPVEVRPANQYFNVPTISGSVQQTPASNGNFSVSDPSWIFPIDVTQPSTSKMLVKVSYTPQFIISRENFGSNIPVKCKVSIELGNNQTGTSFLIGSGRLSSYFTDINGLDFVEVDLGYQHPVVENFITSDSFEDIAGSSDSGYSLVFKFSGELRTTGGGGFTSITLQDPTIIYQELFQ